MKRLCNLSRSILIDFMLWEYCRNCLDEPILITGPEPLLTQFGSHYRLEGYKVMVQLDRITDVTDVSNG